MDERYKNDYNGTDTKLIPRRTDMLKVAPFLDLWVGVNIRILSPRLMQWTPGTGLVVHDPLMLHHVAPSEKPDGT